MTTLDLQRTAYQNLNDSQFKTLMMKPDVSSVVSFSADWSSESQALDNINQALSGRFSRISFFRIDTSANTRYYKAYRFNRVPVTLFIRSGSIIKHIEGCPSLSSYSKMIQSSFAN